MSSLLEIEIRLHLARYLSGTDPLETFEEWLMPAVWDVTPENDPCLSPFVSEIQLAFAEHSNGHLSEDELRRELKLYRPLEVAAGSSSSVNQVVPLPTIAIPKGFLRPQCVSVDI